MSGKPSSMTQSDSVSGRRRVESSEQSAQPANRTKSLNLGVHSSQIWKLPIETAMIIKQKHQIDSNSHSQVRNHMNHPWSIRSKWMTPSYWCTVLPHALRALRSCRPSWPSPPAVNSCCLDCGWLLYSSLVVIIGWFRVIYSLCRHPTFLEKTHCDW